MAWPAVPQGAYLVAPAFWLLLVLCHCMTSLTSATLQPSAMSGTPCRLMFVYSYSVRLLVKCCVQCNLT